VTEDTFIICFLLLYYFQCAKCW